MIRGNLATRPFYNERGVRGWLFVLSALLLAVTLFNVVRIISDSQNDTELATRAARDESTAAALRKQAATLRGTVDPKQIDRASAEAKQANDLIDRRTFSWTELFNLFETTLPDDVRITSVRPKVDAKKGFLLSMTVVARDVKDISQLMENLESTGAFAELLPTEQHVTEQGLLEALLDARYTPGRGTVAPTSERSR